MPRANLSKAWLYAGTTYGPGADIEMPDEVHQALGKKGAFPVAARAGVAPAAPGAVGAAAPGGGVAAGGAADDAPPETAPDPIANAVGQEVAGALRDAGFGTVEAIAAASEEDLRAVDGVGPVRLAALRALKPGEE